MRMVRDPWRSERALLLVLVGVALSLAVACGGDDDGGATPTAATPTAATTTAATPTAATLSGTVSIDGSSTVFPVSEAVAEEFGKLHRDVRVTVGVSGTGGGFEKFCAGETDISDASRPIKDSEREKCAAADIDFIELRVGLDGLAVVANPDADWLTGITLEELNILWGPEAEETVTSWSQVRSGWPDEDIVLFGPDVDSGTFDFFTEEVNGESKASRADYTNSADDNVLVIGISGSSGASGYFGYAYYVENEDKLRIVPVEGVTPSDETVGNGSYPLSRPLYIYVAKQSLTKPQVREFVRYYLSEEGIPLVSDVGYTNIPSTELEQARATLEAAIAEVS
ncbi:MAG: PstS family phosphate ABC transporter substrate-binding protein [Chloroflexi bacterium]|nr:PstS family phosphate ABC transporter substrate-binding protein [Chloroflexota bacterium]